MTPGLCFPRARVAEDPILNHRPSWAAVRKVAAYATIQSVQV